MKTPGLVKALFGEEEIRRMPTPAQPEAVRQPQAGARLANAGFPAPGNVPPPPGFNQGEGSSFASSSAFILTECLQFLF